MPFHLRLLCVLTLTVTGSTIHAADTSILSVTKVQPQDGILIITDDASSTYLPEQVEAVALDPFCASVVASAPNAQPVTLWRECVSAGRLVRTAEQMHVSYALPGAPGRSLALIASNPIAGSNTDLKVIARFVVSSHVAILDGGAAPGASK